MKQSRKKYDREFKQKAVELSFASGNATEIVESYVKKGSEFAIEGNNKSNLGR